MNPLASDPAAKAESGPIDAKSLKPFSEIPFYRPTGEADCKHDEERVS